MQSDHHTPHVFITPDELERARAKIDTAAWAGANLARLCADLRHPHEPAPATTRAYRCAMAFALTDEEQFARLAVEAVKSVKDLVGEWGGNTLRISAHLCFYLAAMEIIAHRLSPRQRQRLHAMVRRANDAVWANDRGDSNWQASHNCAMLAVGLYFDEPQWVDRALEHETRGFVRHLRLCVRDDGLWWEGSMGYHMGTTRHLQLVAEMMRRAGTDFYDVPECRRKLKAMLDVPLRAATGDLTVPGKNDGAVAGSLLAAAARYEIGYARFKDPAYGWLLSQAPRDSMEALLYGEARPRSAAPKAESSVLKDSGWAVMRHPQSSKYWRGDGLCALIDCGPYGSWHGHPDAMSLDLHALGRLLLQDQGSSPNGYDPREHWQWYRSTLAHNTVTVDGVCQGFAYGGDNAPAEAGTGGGFDVTHLGRDVQMIEARADNLYPGAIYRRAVVTVGADYVVDFFRVAAPGRHVFDYALHGSGWLSLDSFTEPARQALRPTPQCPPARAGGEMPWGEGIHVVGQTRFAAEDPHAPYEYAHDVYACEPVGVLCGTFHGGLWTDGTFLTGGPGLKAHVIAGPGTRVFACRTPRNAPKARAADGPTMIVRRTGGEANFATVLAPFRSPVQDKTNWAYHAMREPEEFTETGGVRDVRQVDLGGDVQCVEVRTADGKDLIVHTFLPSAAAVHEPDGVRFEGKFCHLRFDKRGRLAAAEVVNALRLKVKGVTVHSARRPGCCSWRPGGARQD